MTHFWDQGLRLTPHQSINVSILVQKSVKTTRTIFILIWRLSEKFEVDLCVTESGGAETHKVFSS